MEAENALKYLFQANDLSQYILQPRAQSEALLQKKKSRQEVGWTHIYTSTYLYIYTYIKCQCGQPRDLHLMIHFTWLLFCIQLNCSLEAKQKAFWSKVQHRKAWKELPDRNADKVPSGQPSLSLWDLSQCHPAPQSWWSWHSPEESPECGFSWQSWMRCRRTKAWLQMGCICCTNHSGNENTQPQRSSGSRFSVLDCKKGRGLGIVA